MLSTDALACFLAVVKHGSFSAAARQLGKVPSAISMMIGNLETDLDLTLFDRIGREPTLTAHAQALLPQVRLIIEQLDKLSEHAHALRNELETRFTLVVVPELLATAPWSEALSALSSKYPLLEVEVLSAPQSDALDMLRNGRARLALVYERLGIDGEEHFQEVAQETFVAVLSPTHPLLGNGQSRPIRDEDLLHERQVVVAGRHSPEVDKRISISRIQWRTDSPVAALQMIENGLGWGWLPKEFAQSALASGRLVMIPSANFTNVLNLWIDVVWSKTTPLGAAAREFVAFMEHREDSDLRAVGDRKLRIPPPLVRGRVGQDS